MESKKIFIFKWHENEYFLDIIKMNKDLQKIKDDFDREINKYAYFLETNKPNEQNYQKCKEYEKKLNEYEDFFENLHNELAKKSNLKKFFPTITIKNTK